VLAVGDTDTRVVDGVVDGVRLEVHVLLGVCEVVGTGVVVFVGGGVSDADAVPVGDTPKEMDALGVLD